MVFLLADLGHALPHLAGTEPWVAEPVDQRGDDLAAPAGLAAGQQRAAQNDPQVEAFDPLRRPVGGQLLGADAPYLFGVGLEEDAEQAPAELVADPILEGLRILDRLQACPRVAGQAQDGLDRTEVPERVDGLYRVREEPAAVVDARKAAASQHLRAEDLRPQVLDLFVLGEEPVTADVEPVALVLDGAGQPAHLLRVLLDHRDRHVALEQLVRGGQTSGPRAHDDDVLPFAIGDQGGHRVSTGLTSSAVLYCELRPPSPGRRGGLGSSRPGASRPGARTTPGPRSGCVPRHPRRGCRGSTARSFATGS